MNYKKLLKKYMSHVVARTGDAHIASPDIMDVDVDQYDVLVAMETKVCPWDEKTHGDRREVSSFDEFSDPRPPRRRKDYNGT